MATTPDGGEEEKDAIQEEEELGCKKDPSTISSPGGSKKECLISLEPPEDGDEIKAGTSVQGLAVESSPRGSKYQTLDDDDEDDDLGAGNEGHPSPLPPQPRKKPKHSPEKRKKRGRKKSPPPPPYSERNPKPHQGVLLGSELMEGGGPFLEAQKDGKGGSRVKSGWI